MDLKLIRKRRRELDLTQEQAAELAGLDSKQRWSQIESGHRSDIRISTLLKMARVLRLRPMDLIVEDDSSTSTAN